MGQTQGAVGRAGTPGCGVSGSCLRAASSFPFQGRKYTQLIVKELEDTVVTLKCTFKVAVPAFLLHLMSFLPLVCLIVFCLVSFSPVLSVRPVRVSYWRKSTTQHQQLPELKLLRLMISKLGTFHIGSASGVTNVIY